jgi:hypothetical protein
LAVAGAQIRLFGIFQTNQVIGGYFEVTPITRLDSGQHWGQQMDSFAMPQGRPAFLLAEGDALALADPIGICGPKIEACGRKGAIRVANRCRDGFAGRAGGFFGNPSAPVASSLVRIA